METRPFGCHVTLYCLHLPSSSALGWDRRASRICPLRLYIANNNDGRYMSFIYLPDSDCFICTSIQRNSSCRHIRELRLKPIIQMAVRKNKRANLVIARIIPLLVIRAFAYACYAVTKPLCGERLLVQQYPRLCPNRALVDYLIHPYPDYNRSPRVGAGAAIIVIFYVILIPVLTTYIRLLYTVIWNTGFLPRGAQWAQQREEAEESSGGRRKHRKEKGREKRHEHAQEKAEHPRRDVESGLDYNAPGKAYPFDASGLESFYSKDVFVCMEDGRPPYCSKCCQYKTDRAHHCREVDRCVRKMDHFCPWYCPIQRFPTI